MAEITKEVARKIIALLPHRSDKQLANNFGIAQAAVRAIREGHSWNELPRKQIITDAQRSQMIQLRNQGLSYAEIGRRLTISRTAVSRYLQKYRLECHENITQSNEGRSCEQRLPAFKDKGWLKLDKQGKTTLTELGLHIFAKSVVIDKATYAEAARYMRADVQAIRDQLQMMGITKNTLQVLIKSAEEVESLFPASQHS